MLGTVASCVWANDHMGPNTYSLNTGDVYRLYFGSTVLPPTFSNSLTVDNVTVAAVVPEPETYAMMLAGLGALGMMSRRRRLGGKA